MHDVRHEIIALDTTLREYEKFKLLVAQQRLNADSHQMRLYGEKISERLKDRSMSSDAQAFMWARLELIDNSSDDAARQKIYDILKKHGIDDVAESYVAAEPVKSSPRSPREWLGKLVEKIKSPRGRKVTEPEAAIAEGTRVSRENSPRQG